MRRFVNTGMVVIATILVVGIGYLVAVSAIEMVNAYFHSIQNMTF